MRRCGRSLRRRYSRSRSWADLGPAHMSPRAGETFEWVAVGHRGNVLGRGVSRSVAGAMADADAAVPLEKAYSVTVRGEYTSDGTHWPGHGGRMVAGREMGGGRGRGGWITY